MLQIQEISMITNRLLKEISYMLISLAFTAEGHAAVTDISSTPLNTYSAPSSTDVKPNIMFVLDNSGSMAWEHMPDDSGDGGSAVPFTYGYYGYRSSQCNGVYYNPTITYKVPVNGDGVTYYPAATFTAALPDGYKTATFGGSNDPVNLSTGFQTETDSTGVAAYYYSYSGSQTTENLKNYYDSTSTFAKECSSANGASPGSAVFTKVIVAAGEQQNFANWYSYYRTRMLMMKTASGLAFKNIDDRFRVGFMAINNASGTGDFLNIGVFNSAQKSAWYSSLYASQANGSTPLRSALADAGRMYAGKLSSRNGVTVTDPLQYSCQQNYTILSTDGFWNTGSGYKMDGNTAVGNQDAALPRPYFDGGSATLQARTSTLQSQTVSSQLQSRSGPLQKCTIKWNGNLGSCASVTSCQPTSSTACRYSWGSWSGASSCTVNYSSGSGNWTIARGTDCQTVPKTGTWTPATSCTVTSTNNCGYSLPSSWSDVGSCTAVPQSAGPVNYTVGTATDCQTIPSGGTSNTLADVAAYYYNTDLRNPDATQGTGTCIGPIIAPATTPTDLCADKVPASGLDVARTQHMTTFTLGLGVRGRMVYSPTYRTDTTGDFAAISSPTTAGSGICSWQASGVCNWPIPGMNSNSEGLIENVDDLWHAAVNGHGTYFSATSPDLLASGLTSALTTIINTPRPGTAAAAASSNPNVSASDNYVFSSSYKSVEWYGELIRQQITGTTLSAQNWSAMKLLDCATTPWVATHSYIIGNVYRQGTTCYEVTAGYSSGTTFDPAGAGVDLSNTVVVNVDETATPKVPATGLTSRTIYTKGATALIPFQWSSLSSAQQAYFTAPAITYASATSGLSQFCSSGGTCLSTTAQNNNTIASGGAAGEALVNFLRGDRSQETTYFRPRTHVLGDIVSSEARYVKTPLFSYDDANYSAFKTAKASRSGAVYVGSNDGMLHAFDATSGQELWAYIPSIVLPGLYKLADKNYATQHQYFVDSSPEVGDICPNAPASTCSESEWKTILVGGLNRGGTGYYALDITDPATPKMLWEFTDTNLGYTYGNPRITKLKDGTWVVLVSSGYNNADGLGRLYVLNANTGAIIRSIPTTAGTPTSPSGVARISAHSLLPMTDNTSTAAYGGDVLGNLWRFDINGDIGAAGYDAQLLVSFKDATDSSIAQPITVKPVVATINGKPVVFVGTGRYLGTTDVTDAHNQSFYAVMDKLDATTLGNPRTASNGFVQQTLTDGTCPTGAPTTVCIPNQVVRTSSSNVVDWTTNNGWYVDFPTAGERSVTDPSLGLGTILFTTITPQASSVSACGDATGTSPSFVYALDYLTGGAVSGASAVSGVSLGSGLVTRPVLIEQSDGTVRALIRTSSGASSGTDLGGTVVISPPVAPPSSSVTRRVSWRELAN